MPRSILQGSDVLSHSRFMNRLQAFRQALVTVQARAGQSDPDRQGRFVPYAYAASALPLGEDEMLPWLEARMASERTRYRQVLLYARQFSALFAKWKHAAPLDTSRPRFDQQWFSGLDALQAHLEPDALEAGFWMRVAGT